MQGLRCKIHNPCAQELAPMRLVQVVLFTTQGSLLQEVPLSDDGALSAVAVNADGDTAAIARRQGMSIMYYDHNSGAWEHEDIQAVNVTVHPSLVTSTSAGPSLSLRSMWPVQPDLPIRAIAWRPDSAVLALGSSDGRLELHEAFVTRTSHGSKYQTTHLTACHVHIRSLSTGAPVPICLITAVFTCCAVYP